MMQHRDPAEDNCVMLVRKKRYTKKLKKLFPGHIRHLVKFDNQGLYSTTEYEIAESMTDILSNACWLHTKQQACGASIVDCTAGIGGNTMSFACMFKKVYALELNYTRWMYLHRNMSRLKLGGSVTCIHNNFLTYVYENMLSHTQMFFIDPPWGGTSYKQKHQLRLYLSGTPLHEVVNRLPHHRPAVCGIKVPYNFALSYFSERLDKHVRVQYVSHFGHVWLIVCYIYPPSDPAVCDATDDVRGRD